MLLTMSGVPNPERISERRPALGSYCCWSSYSFTTVFKLIQYSKMTVAQLVIILSFLQNSFLQAKMSS